MSARDRFWYSFYAAYDEGDLDKVASFISAFGGLHKAVDAWTQWKASKTDWAKEPVNPAQHEGVNQLFGATVIEPSGVIH